jgi:threonine dehydratase
MAEHPVLADVYAARGRTAGWVRRTPLAASTALSRALNADVRLKLEILQDTRAFKLRGAANAILAAPAEARTRGLVTYSTGNHGRAVAFVAASLCVPATVCVSERTTADKRRALEAMGCRLRVEGASQDEAVDRAKAFAAAEGLFLVDPINDPATIAGHGTIGLELVEDFDGLDTVVVPVSGGALVCGVALAVKAAHPRARVVGVSMARGAAMAESLKVGRPVLVDEVESLADSLQGGILLDNRHTFAMVQTLVDELLLVSEDEIATAMAFAFLQERLVLEGAAAAPLAALLFRPRRHFGGRIAAMATGAAVEPGQLARIAADRATTVEAALTEGRAAA